MSLFGRYLDQSCSAQFQPDQLIAKVSTHFDFDNVKKRTPPPAVLLSCQDKLLPRLPICDVKGPRSAYRAVGVSLGDGVARQRKFSGQTRGWCVALNHDGV